MKEDNRFKNEVQIKLSLKTLWYIKAGPFDESYPRDWGYCSEGRYLSNCKSFQTMPYHPQGKNFIYLQRVTEVESDCDYLMCSYAAATHLIRVMDEFNDLCGFPSDEEMEDELREMDRFENEFDIWSPTPDHSRDMEVV